MFSKIAAAGSSTTLVATATTTAVTYDKNGGGRRRPGGRGRGGPGRGVAFITYVFVIATISIIYPFKFGILSSSSSIPIPITADPSLSARWFGGQYQQQAVTTTNNNNNSIPTNDTNTTAVAVTTTAKEASTATRIRQQRLHYDDHHYLHHDDDRSSRHHGCSQPPSTNTAITTIATTDNDLQASQQRYPPLSSPTTAIICAIVKDEKPLHLDEFVEYHLGLGFHTIYLYDNSDNFDLKNYTYHKSYSSYYGGNLTSIGSDNIEINTTAHDDCPTMLSSSSSSSSSSMPIQPRGVQVIHFPGKQKQMRSYVNCVKQYGLSMNHTYAAFFDIDELLILKRQHNNYIFINDFLAQYLPLTERTINTTVNDAIAGAIGINWVIFGAAATDPNQHYRPEPMSKRFQYRIGFNKLFKTIARIDAIQLKPAQTPHSMNLKHGFVTKDLNGNTISHICVNPMGKNTTDTIAAIYHYKYKSQDEYYEKLQRGRADLVSKSYNNLPKEKQQKLLSMMSNSTTFDDSGWNAVKRIVPEYSRVYN